MKDLLPIEDAHRRLTDYLAASHLRKTPERFAILDCLYGTEGHVDAETLYQKLKDTYHVSRATVYNVLEVLVNAKVAWRVTPSGMAALYERMTLRPHHHTVCMKCGRLTNFYDDQMRTDLTNKKIKNFRAIEVSILIYGRCRHCKQNRQ